MITLAEWYTNVHRDRKEAPKAFHFPRPWPADDAVPQVTDKERAALTESLLARSALRDR